MERYLRALGQRTKENEEEGRQVETVPADRIAGREHDVEVVAADDMAEHEHAGEQAETSRRRDGERDARAGPGARIMLPVADQQKREKARQLPEEHELDEVARQHHAEHRPHEREQEREKARDRILRRHVVARIEEDQEADAGDEEREDPGEAVEPQDDRESRGRHPRPFRANHLSTDDIRIENAEDRDLRERDPAGEPGFEVPCVCGKEGGNETACGRNRDGDKKQRFARHRPSVNALKYVGRTAGASCPSHPLPIPAQMRSPGMPLCPHGRPRTDGQPWRAAFPASLA